MRGSDIELLFAVLVGIAALATIAVALWSIVSSLATGCP
jgi:hypothetical protein